MELQEKAREEKEIEELKKVIEEHLNNLSKNVTNGEFKDMLLKYEELIVKIGKISYFSSLARSAFNLALDYISIASKSPYARELAIIHLLFSRLYADITYALLQEINLDLVIEDVIKVSISLTDFPLSINVVQELDEISKKIDNMIFDHIIKAQLKEDLKKLINVIKGKYVEIKEFDDGVFIDINSENVFDNEVHEAIVEVYRDRNKKIVAIDITYEDKND